MGFPYIRFDHVDCHVTVSNLLWHPWVLGIRKEWVLTWRLKPFVWMTYMYIHMTMGGGGGAYTRHYSKLLLSENLLTSLFLFLLLLPPPLPGLVLLPLHTLLHTVQDLARTGDTE